MKTFGVLQMVARHVSEGPRREHKDARLRVIWLTLADASGYHPRNANRIWDATLALADASGYQPMFGCHANSMQ